MARVNSKKQDLAWREWAARPPADEMSERPPKGAGGKPYMWKEMDLATQTAMKMALEGAAACMTWVSEWYYHASKDAKLSKRCPRAWNACLYWMKLAAAGGDSQALENVGSIEPWLNELPEKRPYNWKTVDMIAGVKVLENIHGLPFLPDLSGSSKAYILCDAEGRFLQMVEFDDKHMPRRQIAYHAELSLDRSGKPIPHYHEIRWPYRRGPAKRLTRAQLRKYAKFMRGRPEYAG